MSSNTGINMTARRATCIKEKLPFSQTNGKSFDVLVKYSSCIVRRYLNEEPLWIRHIRMRISNEIDGHLILLSLCSNANATYVFHWRHALYKRSLSVHLHILQKQQRHERKLCGWLFTYSRLRYTTYVFKGTANRVWNKQILLQLCYRRACGTTLDGHWTPINIRLFFFLYVKQTKNELPAMDQLPVRQNLHFISDRVHSIRFVSANISLAPNGILADGELLLRPTVVEWKCRHHPRYLRIAVDRPQ